MQAIFFSVWFGAQRLQRSQQAHAEAGGYLQAANARTRGGGVLSEAPSGQANWPSNLAAKCEPQPWEWKEIVLALYDEDRGGGGQGGRRRSNTKETEAKRVVEVRATRDS